jgi:hypothetical protein
MLFNFHNLESGFFVNIFIIKFIKSSSHIYGGKVKFSFVITRYTSKGLSKSSPNGSFPTKNSYIQTAVDQISESGALRLAAKTGSIGGVTTTGGAGYMGIDFDTARAGSWSGATSSAGSHAHTVNVSSGGSHTHTTNNTGGGTPLNILPPYQTVYMWKRTA